MLRGTQSVATIHEITDEEEDDQESKLLSELINRKISVLAGDKNDVLTSTDNHPQKLNIRTVTTLKKEENIETLHKASVLQQESGFYSFVAG